jgi:hypothetical protein
MEGTRNFFVLQNTLLTLEATKTPTEYIMGVFSLRQIVRGLLLTTRLLIVSKWRLNGDTRIILLPVSCPPITRRDSFIFTSPYTGYHRNSRQNEYYAQCLFTKCGWMAAKSRKTTLWIRWCVKWGRAAILLYDGFVAIKMLLYTVHHISAASQLGSSCEESIQCTTLGEPVTCDAGKCNCLRDAFINGETCHKKKCEYIPTVNRKIWFKYVKNSLSIILRLQKIFSRTDPLHISP